MQTTTNASANPGWVEYPDDDPLGLDITGGLPIPAYDQPAPRANRIPRIAASQPSLFRRLHITAKRLYLEWLLFNLGKQLDAVEADLAEKTEQAIAASRKHRHSPLLNARRRDLARQFDRLGARMLAVRRELDNLAVAA